MTAVISPRRRADRLEAARHGALDEIAFDLEEMLFGVARRDDRYGKVCKEILAAKFRPDIVGMAGHQTFSELVEPVMVADYAAVSPAAATETVLWTPNTTTQPHTAIPANFITRQGQQIKLRAGGVMTVPGTAGTTTLNPRWGTTTSGTALGASSAIAAGTVSQTGVPWLIQAHGIFRALGSAGTLVFLGTLETNGIARDAIFGGSTATVDTTTAQGIVFGVTHSVASYSWTPKLMPLEVAG